MNQGMSVLRKLWNSKQGTIQYPTVSIKHCSLFFLLSHKFISYISAWCRIFLFKNSQNHIKLCNNCSNVHRSMCVCVYLFLLILLHRQNIKNLKNHILTWNISKDFYDTIIMFNVYCSLFFTKSHDPFFI